MVSACLLNPSFFWGNKYWLYYRNLLTSIFQLNMECYLEILFIPTRHYCEIIQIFAKLISVKDRQLSLKT